MLWKYEKIRLPFRIGPKTLAEAAIYGLNCYQHITRISPGNAATPPKLELGKHQASIARYPTCPVGKHEKSGLSMVDGYCRYIECLFPHYLTDTKGSFDDYVVNNLSRNARKKFKRIKRRWSEHCGGVIRWEAYRGSEIEKQFLPAARIVSCKTMQHRILDRGLSEGNHREQQILEEAADDQARGYILFKQNIPVSFVYGYLSEDNILILEYGGFDPHYSPWSVGTLLDYLIIERAFTDSAIDIVDFSEGEGEYKKRFSTRYFDAAHIIYFSPTAKNSFVIGGFYLTAKLSEAIRVLLRKTRLLDKVKPLFK